MPQIFVSYSRNDQDFTQALVEPLNISFHDFKIANTESDVLIYLLSNESVQSIYGQAKANRIARRNLFLGVMGLIVALMVGLFALIPWLDGRLRDDHQTQSPLALIASPTLEFTPAPSLTRTPTATPLEAALERADAFGDLETPANGDWQPFIHEFEDDVPMALVPRGCFRMGSEDFLDTIPVHEQCFDQPFWIDQTEVTQAQFTRLEGSNVNGSCYQGDHRPEECLTWFEARDFANCVVRVCPLNGNGNTPPAGWKVGSILGEITNRLPT